jgi:hypothetical protein
VTLAESLLLIPAGAYLQFGCDSDPEDGSVHGIACLYVKGDATEAITTKETDPTLFELLVVNMIVDRFGTAAQKSEARERLGRHALQKKT